MKLHNIVLATALFVNASSYATETFDTSVIPGASYFVWKKAKRTLTTCQEWDSYCYWEAYNEVCVSRYYPYNPAHTCALFYSYDGKLIKQVACPKDTSDNQMEQKLDPAAPKAQPSFYKIKHIQRLPKGPRGGFCIIFYDRHSNIIADYSLDNDKKNISVIFSSEHTCTVRDFALEDVISQRANPDFPLDLSKVREA